MSAVSITFVLLICLQVIKGDGLDFILFPVEDNTQPPRIASQPVRRAGMKPRSPINDVIDGGTGNSFNVRPSSDGSISGSGSFANSYAGTGYSAGQSHSFSFSAGHSAGGEGGGAVFSVSQAASQASSFNSHSGHQGLTLASSQASSQSSSFSGTSGGFSGGGSTSSASSQAVSVGLSTPGVASAGANSDDRRNDFGTSLSGGSALSQNTVTSTGGNVGNIESGHRDGPNLIPAEFVRSLPRVVNNTEKGNTSHRRHMIVGKPIYDLYSQFWSPFIRTSFGHPNSRKYQG